MSSGCGCKEVYRFPHITYDIPTTLVSALFVHNFYFFPFLFQYIFVIYKKKFAQYKQTNERLRASHSSHMKAAHNVLYTKKHTQTYASYPAMDISCMTSRNVV